MVVSEPYWESGTGTKPMADAFLYCLSLCVLIHCRSQYEGIHGRTQRKGGRGIHTDRDADHPPPQTETQTTLPLRQRHRPPSHLRQRCRPFPPETDADHPPTSDRRRQLPPKPTHSPPSPLRRRKRPMVGFTFAYEMHMCIHDGVCIPVDNAQFFICQSGCHMTTKSDRSDWQSRDQKVGQVRLAVTRPLNLTGQTGSHVTKKSDRSDWQSHDH